MFYSKKLKRFKELKHCFFSNRNGYSKGIYKSLNCGQGSKDSKKNIKKNLKLVAKKMRVKSANLVLMHQTHSNNVIEIKKMKFRDQSDLYLRLKRLLHPKLMGNLFKVALAYNCKNKNFNGFN